MSPTSFPGVSSSPAPSTSNNNINDDISNQSKMEEYERRWQERHSEETHKAALAAALARHNEIRERALGVLEIEQLREETEMLRQKRIQTEERVRLETQRAMEQMRIREEENKARQIPQPPPRVPTPPQAASTAAPQPKQQNITPAPTNQQANQPISAASRHSPPNPFQSSQNQPSPLGTSQGTQNQPSTSQPKQPQPTPSNPMQSQAQRAAQQPNQAQRSMQAPPMVPQQPPNPSQVPQAAQASSAQPQVKRLLLHQSVDRYVDIHKTLKSVRKAVKDHGEKDPQFKKKAGDMRRAITRSVGQLTEGKGVNKVPVDTIAAQLEASLGISPVLEAVPSQPFPPTLVMTTRPEPGKEGTLNNGTHMPSLTIYLLNILAKAALSQFCSEAGANPKTADPIGVILVSVFSQEKFCWRGQSLIDIVIAKFRILCPVLFGIRGNEKTEEGRAKLGWKKDQNGNWISEQEHNDRMTGLGAGYASICLRDFSRSRLNNPFPSTNYWFSLAAITSTRPEDTSSTQFVVLKAMIDNYTVSFLKMYGDMGVRALHVALEDFPRRAAAGNVAASSLQVLAAKLRRDTGLILAVN